MNFGLFSFHVSIGSLGLSLGFGIRGSLLLCLFTAVIVVNRVNQFVLGLHILPAAGVVSLLPKIVLEHVLDTSGGVAVNRDSINKVLAFEQFDAGEAVGCYQNLSFGELGGIAFEEDADL